MRYRLPARALDADHVGAQVGEDHAGVRTGADARDLDDLHPAQRTGALTEFVAHAADHGSPATGARGGRGAPDLAHVTRTPLHFVA